MNEQTQEPAGEIRWLPDRGEVTFADYQCPVCGGIEHVSSLMDQPLLHRHRYGRQELQTGVVLLRPVVKEEKY